MVDWAVTNTDGTLNALIVTAAGPLSSNSTLAARQAELVKGEVCKRKVVEFPDSWANKITSGVQSALLGDPSINYIIVMYDPMMQFVVPAVTLTGSKAKVDGFNATPFAVGFVRQGKEDMILGKNLDWIGYAIVDDELRRLCGLPPVADPKMPLYIYDAFNASGAGTPPQLSQGYGDAYVDGYAKLWKIK